MTFVLRRCFWLVDLGFLATAAALCAALVGSLIPYAIHIPQISFAFSSIPAVAKTSLDLQAVSQVTGLPAASEPVAAPVPSALSVKLLGTSVSDLSGLSLATLQDLGAKETGIYAVGDSIQGATVLEIERLRVTVDNHGRREVIALEQSVVGSGAIPASASGIVALGDSLREIDRKLVADFLSNPTRELTKALFVPAFDGGATRGWTLKRLSADSLLGKLGLAQGDVVRRINGFELNDPAKLLEALTRLPGASQIQVEIERNGAPRRLDYRIGG